MVITELKVRLVRFQNAWMAIPLVRHAEVVGHTKSYLPAQIEHRKGYGDSPHEALGHLLSLFNKDTIQLTRAFVDINDEATMRHCVFTCRSEYELI